MTRYLMLGAVLLVMVAVGFVPKRAVRVGIYLGMLAGILMIAMAMRSQP